MYLSNFKLLFEHSNKLFCQSLFVVDSHTGGEPTKIVLAGFPPVSGHSMIEKKQFVACHHDELRKTLMHEPRGHKDMLGALIVEPSSAKADFGVVFMDGGGYLDMCGDGVISVMTVAVESGIVLRKTPVTSLLVDTPAGLISGKVFIEQDAVKKTSFVNVPSFLYQKDIAVNVSGIGLINIDMSYGGNFFILVDAEQIGLHIDLSNLTRLIEIGGNIKLAVNDLLSKKMLKSFHGNGVGLVAIFEKITNTRLHYKNIVIFGDGLFDRSPCGTGTSAKLASLYARGEISKNDIITNESILGTKFTGSILDTVIAPNMVDFPAIIPEISGSAYITGLSQIVLSCEDPFVHGFTLNTESGGKLLNSNLNEQQQASTFFSK